MTLNTTRSNVPHIRFTSSPESQISIHFPLRPLYIVVELRIVVVLRAVHRMTPQWPWTLRGQRYPIYPPLVPRVPNCHSVSLYGQMFSGFDTSGLNDHKWRWKATRSKRPYICSTKTPESQISLKFAPWATFFRNTDHFETSAPNDPNMTLNTTVRRNRIPCTQSPKFHSILLND